MCLRQFAHADVVLELCSRVLASMSYGSTVERRCRPLVREASARHVPPRGLVVLIKYCKPTRRLFVRRHILRCCAWVPAAGLHRRATSHAIENSRNTELFIRWSAEVALRELGVRTGQAHSPF